MDQQQKEESKKRNRFTKLDMAIILAIILILISVVVPSMVHFLRAGQAREVLGRAKTVCLATQVTSYDYYVEGAAIMDATEDSGLVDEAVDEILERSGAEEGKLFRVKLNAHTNKVIRMTYVENGYVAVYVRKGQEPSWNVYRLDQIIAE